MKIGIASDHRGYKLKNKLIKKLECDGIEVLDVGTTTPDRCDYTKYAKALTEKVINKDCDFGVAICGTGIGMSIACNKVKGIYCAKVSSINDARFAKRHNYANVLAFGEKTCPRKAYLMIKEYINNENDKDKSYVKRINDIKEIEND